MGSSLRRFAWLALRICKGWSTKWSPISHTQLSLSHPTRNGCGYSEWWEWTQFHQRGEASQSVDHMQTGKNSTGLAPLSTLSACALVGSLMSPFLFFSADHKGDTSHGSPVRIGIAWFCAHWLLRLLSYRRNGRDGSRWPSWTLNTWVRMRELELAFALSHHELSDEDCMALRAPSRYRKRFIDALAKGERKEWEE